MKNLIPIFLLFIVIVFTSCSDLNEDPQGILAPEGFFESKKDVESALFGAYGRMTSSDVWGGEGNAAIMAPGDMVDAGSSGAPAHVFERNNFNLTSTHNWSTLMWKKAYDVIGAANNAILGAQTIKADEKIKATLEAEARVIRAFTYYIHVQLFGDMPYIDRVVTDPDAVVTMSRTPESEIYTHIIEDLKFGKEHLPLKYESNIRTRATNGTAATILASVNLTLGNWQEAYDNAKWVIDHAAELDYSLVENFQDLFNATKQDGISEHIFAVDFLGLLKGGGDNDDYLANQTGNEFTGGWNVIIPSLAVYNTWDSRDYRKKVSLADTIISGDKVVPYTEFSVPRPLIAKYWRYPGNSKGGGRRSDTNYVLFRYAEVLLIAAEALNELSGPNAEALGYINQVRSRARIWPEGISEFPANVSAGLTQEQFRDTVLDERRLELAFEYKRWFDIKRRDLGDKVFKGANSLEPHENFDSSVDYLFPIPQVEIDTNPNLMQNPGYN